MPITIQRVLFQDKFCQINVGLVATLICQKPLWAISLTSQQTWRAAAWGQWFCSPMLCHLPFPLFHPPTPSYGQMLCMLSYRWSIPRIYVMLGLVRDGLSERALETSEGRHLTVAGFCLDFCKQSVVQGLINWVTMTTRDFHIKYSLPAWHFGCLGNKTWCNGYLSQLESKRITGSVLITRAETKFSLFIHNTL